MSGVAWAQGAAATGGASPLANIIPIVLIIFVFYFVLIRPQQKKAKEHQSYLSNLKKGDKVVTAGGIHGQITGLTDTVITLEIADNVRIKVNRGSVMGGTAEASQQPKTGG
jgi:preprotein translocase subunit YajC